MDWNKKVYPKDIWDKFISILPKRTGTYVRINEGMHKRVSGIRALWVEYCRANRDIWKLIISFRPKRRTRPTSTSRSEPPIRSGRPMFSPPPPKPRRNIEDEHKLSKEIDDEINDIWESISRKKRTKSILDSINSRRRMAKYDDMWGNLEQHGIFESQKDYPITQAKKPKGRTIF